MDLLEDQKNTTLKAIKNQQRKIKPATLNAAQDTMRLLESAESAQGKPASVEQFKNILSNISNTYKQQGSPDVTPKSIVEAIQFRNSLLNRKGRK